MRKVVILLIIVLGYFKANAGKIKGEVIDPKKREPIINAKVQAFKDSNQKGVTITNIDGEYLFDSLEEGTYTLVYTHPEYKQKTITGVIVTLNGVAEINAKMSNGDLTAVVVYSKPLIANRKALRKAPVVQTADLITTAAGVRQSKRSGSLLYSDGGRGTGNVFIIDGVQVRGSSGIIINSKTEESYKKVERNDFKNVLTAPVSTMSVDVDRASYSNIRRFLNDDELPPADAVRVEEMVNYFDYTYAQPQGNAPVAFETNLSNCPWDSQHQLLHIGIQAKNVNTEDIPPSNIVFLVDVSGSMMEENKLPLVQASLNLLVDQLRKQDKISLVVYAGNAGLVLPPTAGDEKTKIKNAINQLVAGGSTAGGEGILLAYKIASENFIKGGNNRVVLCTDGDFNVGVTSNSELEKLIVEKRKTGVFLTCLGFGMGNYKDDRMEMLADKGNGNYNYIDNESEANKTMVKEFGGTMFTVAKDVKCQIEFNPNFVSGYRLIGYENRILNTEDFKDDAKDAGDMGAGHSVTVLYEIVPKGVQDSNLQLVDSLKYQIPFRATNAASAYELATIKMRYKEPDSNTSKEVSHVVAYNIDSFENTNDNVRFSTGVAMFGMLMGDYSKLGSMNFKQTIKILEDCEHKDEYRSELLKLAGKASKLRKAVVKN